METRTIQLTLNADAIERVEHLKQVYGLDDYGEVVRNALRLFVWYTKMISEGYDIGLVRDDALIKTVVLLF